MELENLPPNKPNFLLVVLISAGVLLVVFVIALAFIHYDGKHMFPHTFTKHVTSRLVLPQRAGVTQA